MAANEQDNGTGLKAKEKVLVQLGEHRPDPDQMPLPFEITQKGLADHLGLRRSHVAMALQDLVGDGMVTTRKSHIDGEERRQNAYLLTEEGARRARDLRAGLIERTVRYEDADGVKDRKVSDIVGSRKVSLSSVIFQLDRSGTVRNEITIVAQSTRRLIPVYCPTCQKQIEVENTFEDEEVGFDCPGCARPYRIVPVLEKTSTGRPSRPSWVYLAVAASIVASIYLSQMLHTLCAGAVVATVIAVVVLIVLAASPSKKKRGRTLRSPGSPMGTLLFALGFGAVLLLAWHSFVKEIDPMEEAALVAPLVVGVCLGYWGIYATAPHLKGEFLITVGLLLVLVAVTIMFTEEFGEFSVSTAPFIGISGGALLGLIKFENIGGNELRLGAALAVGAYILTLTTVIVLGECDSTGDYIAAATLMSVGVFLASLRLVQTMVASHDLGDLLADAVPMVCAVGLAVMAVILMTGEAIVAGAFELLVMLPFGYLGVKRVFDGMWMYKLPFAAFLSGALVLVVSLALHT